MSYSESYSAAGMNMMGITLIVSMKGDLDESDMLQIQKDILGSIQHNSAKEVIIDVSYISMLDLPLFKILRETAQMVSVLGSGVVFVGFKAGIASALVDLDADFGDIRTAVTMDDGFELLKCKDTVNMPEG